MKYYHHHCRINGKATILCFTPTEINRAGDKFSHLIARAEEEINNLFTNRHDRNKDFSALCFHTFWVDDDFNKPYGVHYDSEDKMFHVVATHWIEID